jgi:plasmid maintenance system antidote protein VapI
MALRLAAALGASAESWLLMQAMHDLWRASKKRRPKVEPLKLAAEDWRPHGETF